MKQLFLLLVMFCLNLTILQGQNVPQGFNYQGVARDADNNPYANINLSIRMSLLKDGTNAIVYSESHLVETSDFGIFSIVVGKGNPVNGQFENIDWSSGDYLIKTDIDPNGGADYINAGKSSLFSVPYAMYAFQAANGGNSNNITIKGSVSTITNLPNNADEGDLYITQDDGHGHVWDGNSFIDIGQFRGPQGNQGMKGDKGNQGERGVTGDTGDRGDQGIQGDQGSKGDKGDRGDQGIRGEKGNDGAGVTIIGSVVNSSGLPNTANLGDMYISQNDGHGHVWNGNSFDDVGQIKGPIGDQGIQGPKGDKGDLGPKGDLGNNGDQGIQGIQGLKGDTGEKGDQGDIGAKGDMGIQGVQGDQGPSGDQGIQGLKGNEGEKGDQGIQGLKGDKGDAGIIGAVGPRGEDGYTRTWIYDEQSAGESGKFSTGKLFLQNVSKIDINIEDKDDVDVQTWLQSHVPGDLLMIIDRDITDYFGYYKVTESSINNDIVTFQLDLIVANGDFDDGEWSIGFSKQGPTGAGVKIVGSVANPASLPSPYNGDEGDMYITQNDGHGYIWTGALWNNIGEIKGPKGDKGDKGNKGDIGNQGPIGPQGPAGNEVWKSNGNKIYYNDGQVGIGTNNPSADLEVEDVNGSGAASFRLIKGNNYGTLQATSTAVNLVSSTSNLNLIAGNSGSLTVEQGGSVGIGTSNPTSDLTVVDANNSGSASLGLINNNISIGLYTGSNSNQAGLYTTNSDLNFVFDGSAKAKLKSNGVFQLGSTAVGDLVVGDPDGSGFSSISTNKSSTYTVLQSTATEGRIGTTSQHPLRIMSGSATRIYVDGSEIGINTSTPEEELHVKDADNDGYQIYMESGTKKWRQGVAPQGNAYRIGHVGGNYAYINGNTLMWEVGSDRKLKKDIKNMESVLDRFNKLNVTRYQYKTSEGPTIGMIAQEVQEVFPELVETQNAVIEEGKSPEDFLTFKYSLVPFITVKAVQEQQVIINTQQELIATQQQQIDAMQVQINQIKALINKD